MWSRAHRAPKIDCEFDALQIAESELRAGRRADSTAFHAVQSTASACQRTGLDACDGNSTAAINPLDPLVEQACPTVYVKGSVAWPNALGLRFGTGGRTLMASDSSVPAL
jgi:hypothetical protein